MREVDGSSEIEERANSSNGGVVTMPADLVHTMKMIHDLVDDDCLSSLAAAVAAQG